MASEAVVIIKDIITTIATITTAIVAVTAIRSWRRQTVAKAEHETARTILRSVYRLRDAIYDLREPSVSRNELREGMKKYFESRQFATTDMQAAMAGAFLTRFERFEVALAEFEVSAIEGEVLWGRTFANAALQTRIDTHRLKEAAARFVDYQVDPQTPEYHTDEPIVVRSKAAKDEFGDQLKEGYLAIEEFIRPKLSLGIGRQGE